MVRDRDLLRWGKVGSVVLGIFSLLLFTASISGYFMASRFFGGVSSKVSRWENFLLERVGEAELKDALLVQFDLNANYAETNLELIQVVCIFAAACALFSLNLSVLLWRSNELAHDLNFVKSGRNQENRKSEEG